MALGDIEVNLSGNLTADPEVRFTGSGAAVATFHVACTPRRYNRETSAWEDSGTTFLRVEAWRQQAENIAETLRKGTTVRVVGKLRQREYETREGDKRVVYEVHDANVAVDLQFQTAEVSRANSGGGGGSAPRSAPAASSAPAAAPARSGSVIDEPPF